MLQVLDFFYGDLKLLVFGGNGLLPAVWIEKWIVDEGLAELDQKII